MVIPPQPPLLPLSAMDTEVDKYLNTTATVGTDLPGTSTTSTTTNSSTEQLDVDSNSISSEVNTSSNTEPNGSEDAHNISTQTPPSLDLLAGMSAEVYLTTSSLSAKRSDLHRATPDLSRVDFIRFGSTEDSNKEQIERAQQNVVGEEDDDDDDEDETASEKKDATNVLLDSSYEIIPDDIEISAQGNELSDDQILALSNAIQKESITTHKKTRKKKKHKSKHHHTQQQQQQQTPKNSDKTELASHVNDNHSNKNINDAEKEAAEDHFSPSIPVLSVALASVPFRCWFCSANFNNPEEVVSHMTNEHDNLDNLSRRIEMTDLQPDGIVVDKDLAAVASSSLSKLKHLKMARKSDASLSPAVGMACPNCPKKLGSKEAYELHLMVHETLVSIGQPPDQMFKTNELIVGSTRQRSVVDRVVASETSDDVTLSGKNNIYFLFSRTFTQDSLVSFSEMLLNEGPAGDPRIVFNARAAATDCVCVPSLAECLTRWIKYHLHVHSVIWLGPPTPNVNTLTTKLLADIFFSFKRSCLCKLVWSF